MELSLEEDEQYYLSSAEMLPKHEDLCQGEMAISPRLQCYSVPLFCGICQALWKQ